MKLIRSIANHEVTKDTKRADDSAVGLQSRPNAWMNPSGNHKPSFVFFASS
jgi:hypothetical protein